MKIFSSIRDTPTDLVNKFCTLAWDNKKLIHLTIVWCMKTLKWFWPQMVETMCSHFGEGLKFLQKQKNIVLTTFTTRLKTVFAWREYIHDANFRRVLTRALKYETKLAGGTNETLLRRWKNPGHLIRNPWAYAKGYWCIAKRSDHSTLEETRK